ncbi:bifunctional diaminohydroxyphosphoribosylaminopyrimidine deaminase/5-amino-6-(5-phosphoribosylamino)uracil reductase RibD [Companilactobacillus halodurans]|nr:bifunctional diaminohydroxyphosphoribosylaminopyrimidine deaminase/5-amino-6-(5-phosphoribosylamino)uracil reductase RibD [Companilactobacillus halodurans]
MNDFMKLAFDEARKGTDTWLNPKVGAVIVKDSQVLASGHHQTFGHEHAEINTLNNLKNISMAKGATIFVTLEPCSHFGKTPPCVQRIVEVGLKKVVIGSLDPNPLVSGHGVKYLKDHGIEVENLNIKTDLNQAYMFSFNNHRPLVTLKYAMTLDGKINKFSNERSLISNSIAYDDAQDLRSNNQAVLIGENTFKTDNPQLTVRNKKMKFPPVRIVLVRDVNSVDLSKRIFENQAKIWFLSETKAHRNLPDNVEVFVGDWNVKNILNLLNEKKIQALLVEGGSKIQSEFAQAGMIDHLVIYLAPMIFGNGLGACNGQNQQIKTIEFQKPKYKFLGDNIRISTWRKK